jgi:hypothetical protein
MLEHARRLGDQVPTRILTGVKAGPAGNAGRSGDVVAAEAYPMAAQSAKAREKVEEGIVVLQGGVETEDLIQFRYSWSEIYLTWRHSHLVNENEENVWLACFAAHFVV